MILIVLPTIMDRGVCLFEISPADERLPILFLQRFDDAKSITLHLELFGERDRSKDEGRTMT
jgi:hypothetical protein